jgi:hypothetical protein
VPVPFRKARLAAAVSAALASSYAHAFDVTPAGDEFEVPQDSGNFDQINPDVASDPDGNFVVVWQDRNNYSYQAEILARRFDGAGNAVGNEIPVSNTQNFAIERQPAVAMDDDGNFIVVWEIYSSGNDEEILYRGFDAAGNELIAESFASDGVFSGEDSSDPDVAMDADGDFVITWEQFYSGSFGYDEIAYRTFNASGTGGPQLTASPQDGSSDRHPAVAISAAGEFVIAWDGFDGAETGIFARRFQPNGTPLAADFRVNADTTNRDEFPAIDMDDDGDFLIAWVSRDGSGNHQVDANLFDWNQTSLTGEVTAFEQSTNYFQEPAVALRRDNEWVATRNLNVFDGNGLDVYVRTFQADGTPEGDAFRFNQATDGNQRRSSLAMDDDGNFVVAFQGVDSGSGDDEVLARRFEVLGLSDTSIGGKSGGPGSLGWLGALGLGIAALGRRLLGRRRKRGGVASLLAGALALGTVLAPPDVQAAQDLRLAGEVESASGTVTASRDDESRRSLGSGDPVYVGDRVRTGAGASALLRLADGTEVNLRADSEFRVAGLEGRIEQDGGGLTGLFMDLLRGGLRMVTGTVADSASDRFRLRTPVATIGVRGTEFEARVCRRGQACPGAEESESDPRAPAARLLKLRGVVEATAANGATRVVGAGDGVYEGDTVETAGNAWAVLQFADDSRVSLQPGTRFRVDEWEFERDDAADGNALLNLLRGGMRVLTGLIGGAASDNYRVSTPVATIGVRGTGFDLVCAGSCINADAVLGAVEGDGLFISTWDGTAFAELEGAVAEFAAGETGFIANRVLPAVRLQSLPPALQNLAAPRPDQVIGQLPDGIDRLYAQVEDGTITLQGTTGDALAVGAGSAAAVAAGGPATPISPVAGVGTGLATATLGAAFSALVAQQFDVATLYAGASTGRAGLDSDDAFEDRIQRDFPGASVTSLSNAGIGTRAFGGLRMLEVLAFEVGYVDLGEFRSEVDPGGEDEAAVGEDALDKHPIAATGLDFSALVRTPVNINTWAFARAGVFVWEADVSTTTPSGESFSRSVDGTDPIVGGGVEHKLGPGLWARAEWIHYRLDPDQVNFVGGGLVWAF